MCFGFHWLLVMSNDALNDQPNAWDKLYEIKGRPNLTSDDRKFLEGILSELANANGADVDSQLLRGYAIYHFGAELNIAETCEADLLSVVGVDPTNATALAYLGYFYFDSGKWNLARSFLQRVPLDLYCSEGQQWRSLKIRELIASCDLMMGNVGAACMQIAPLIEELLQSDAAECAVPTELMRALATNADAIREVIGSGELMKWSGKLRTALEAQGVGAQFHLDFKSINSQK